MIAYLKLHVREPLPNVCLCISYDAYTFDLPRLCEMLPQTLLLGFEVEVSNKDTAPRIMRGWMCDGVDADVTVEDYNTVKLERFAGSRRGGKDDIGVEGLLLLVELVGYECSFAGDLF